MTMRTCSRCGASELEAQFYERSGYCKPCHCAYTSARAKAIRAAETFEQREERLARRRLKRHGRAERERQPTPTGLEPGTKWCPHCGEVKPLAGFYMRRAGGYVSHCIACQRVRSRAYYVANREKRIAYQQARRARDLDAAREYERRVYRGRRHKHQAANRARERRMGMPSRDTVAYDTLLRGDPCCYCGRRPVQVDHIVPVGAGGPNHWSNLTAACQRCNRAKSATTLLIHLAEGMPT